MQGCHAGTELRWLDLLTCAALQKVVMHTCPKMDPEGGCDPFLIIEENGKVRLVRERIRTGAISRAMNGDEDILCDGRV